LKRYISFLIFSVDLLLLSGCAHLSQSPHNGIDIWFFNVGYGDATLVREGTHSVLIDGGYPLVTDYLLKALKTLHIKNLEAAILTHPHPDHIGGLYGIMVSGIQVQKVISSYPLDHPEMPEGFRKFVVSANIPCEIAKRGDYLNFGDRIRFWVCNPDSLEADMNDSSLVLKLEDFGGGLLLGSDIGEKKQNELAKKFGNKLRSKILKCPHHGGYADEKFIEAVQPEIVYVSVGVNPYDNPNEDTLNRYRGIGAAVYFSGIYGTMKIMLSPDQNYSMEKFDVPRGTFIGR
jgi:competence protein ComEC